MANDDLIMAVALDLVDSDQVSRETRERIARLLPGMRIAGPWNGRPNPADYPWMQRRHEGTEEWCAYCSHNDPQRKPLANLKIDGKTTSMTGDFTTLEGAMQALDKALRALDWVCV